MKILTLWLCLGSAILLSACATRPPLSALPPVGPAPVASGNAGPGIGTLVVYSAWSTFDNNYESDHSGYMVYAKDGQLVKWVPNFLEGDFTVEPPTRVKLPAGSYNVKAEGGKYGWVLVPIVIKEGATTPIYLDGDRHAVNALASDNAVVKLPNGQVIGWAANPVN